MIYSMVGEEFEKKPRQSIEKRQLICEKSK